MDIKALIDPKSNPKSNPKSLILQLSLYYRRKRKAPEILKASLLTL